MSHNICKLCLCGNLTFSALTLFVWEQEGHPAWKN